MIGSFGKRKFSKNKRNILKTLSKNGALFRALYPHYRGNIQKKQALILGYVQHLCGCEAVRRVVCFVVIGNFLT